METVARREWVIRELDGDAAVMEQLPEGDECRLQRGLLPDDAEAGDRFRVVAQFDRREAGDGSEEAGLPDALNEALENLTTG